MRCTAALLVLLLATQTAWALEATGRNRPAGKPAGAHGGQHLSFTLPERGGVLSWKALSGVERVRQQDRFVPQFPPNIQALDNVEVRLQGYILPLERSDMQKQFILSAAPPSCSFCVFSGPERAVEVRAKKPIKFGFHAIVVSGRLSLLYDDPMGLYYRLNDAAAVAP